MHCVKYECPWASQCNYHFYGRRSQFRQHLIDQEEEDGSSWGSSSISSTSSSSSSSQASMKCDPDCTCTKHDPIVTENNGEIDSEWENLWWNFLNAIKNTTFPNYYKDYQQDEEIQNYIRLLSLIMNKKRVTVLLALFLLTKYRQNYTYDFD